MWVEKSQNTAFMPRKRLDMSFKCDRLVARQHSHFMALPAGAARLSHLNRGLCQDDRGINAVILVHTPFSYPHLPDKSPKLSPIDMTAEGVVKIVQYADKQCVFLLNSNKPIYFDKLLDVFKKLNIKMDIVSGQVFDETLQNIAKDNNTEYIYEAF